MNENLRMLLSEGNWVKLAQVGVDSGVLVITDPCYVHPATDLNEIAYKSIHPTDPDGQELFGTFANGLSLAFHSGYGDGLYSVYGQIEKGNIVRVLVEMDYMDE